MLTKIQADIVKSNNLVTLRCCSKTQGIGHAKIPQIKLFMGPRVVSRRMHRNQADRLATGTKHRVDRQIGLPTDVFRNEILEIQSDILSVSSPKTFFALKNSRLLNVMNGIGEAHCDTVSIA